MARSWLAEMSSLLAAAAVLYLSSTGAGDSRAHSQPLNINALRVKLVNIVIVDVR